MVVVLLAANDGNGNDYGCLAVLGFVAIEAFAVTKRSVPPALAARHDFLRRFVPPIDALRALGPDIGRLAEAITQEVYPTAAAQF